MKVRELKALIARLRDDDEIVIPIKPMNVSVGGQAYLKVESVYAGFDWDHGKVFITPERPVHEADDAYKAEQKTSRDKGEALAFLWMHVTNKSLDDAQKLRAVRATIKRFGFATPSQGDRDEG